MGWADWPMKFLSIMLLLEMELLFAIGSEIISTFDCQHI